MRPRSAGARPPHAFDSNAARADCHRALDVGGGRLRDGREHAAGRGVVDVERPAVRRGHSLAVDDESFEVWSRHGLVLDLSCRL